MKVEQDGVRLTHAEYRQVHYAAEAYKAMVTNDHRRLRIMLLSEFTGVPVYVGPKASIEELEATEEAFRALLQRRLPTDPVAGLAG